MFLKRQEKTHLLVLYSLFNLGIFSLKKGEFLHLFLEGYHLSVVKTALINPRHPKFKIIILKIIDTYIWQYLKHIYNKKRRELLKTLLQYLKELDLWKVSQLKYKLFILTAKKCIIKMILPVFHNSNIT